MSNLKTLLENRFKHTPQNKMEELARKRTQGELSPFLKGFSTPKLSPQEEEKIRALLATYASQEHNIEEDALHICHLSAQVKQIHHQSILLHGERIQKVRDILKTYHEGAFSAWLILTYGNRQTPYNFLMYYELFSKLPDSLRSIMETMPKQAVYTLASRQGDLNKKEHLIRHYQGENKAELLKQIRDAFPLLESDARRTSVAKQALSTLSKGISLLHQCENLSEEEVLFFEKLLKKLQKVKTKLFPKNKV